MLEMRYGDSFESRAVLVSNLDMLNWIPKSAVITAKWTKNAEFVRGLYINDKFVQIMCNQDKPDFV